MTRPTQRYRYQEILWGEEAQRRIRAARVAVFGVGGTGAACAEILARAGVGSLRLIDRDIVEVSDLHRTHLYDAEDAASPTPKVEAAARRIAKLNGDVKAEAVMAYVRPDSALALAAGADVLVDGSDNFPLRLLVNDVAIKTDRPFVYQGAVGDRGAVMAVIPGDGPCLRCLIPDPPPVGGSPTCAQIGVSPAVVAAVGACAAALVLAILCGRGAETAGKLTRFADGRAATIKVPRRDGCPACGRSEFEFLKGRFAVDVGLVCGGCAYEVHPRGAARIAPLIEIRDRLAAHYTVRMGSGVLLVIVNAAVSAVIMDDGRALVYGVSDRDKAEATYDRIFSI